MARFFSCLTRPSLQAPQRCLGTAENAKSAEQDRITMRSSVFSAVSTVKSSIVALALFLVSCASISPIETWLARHGHEIPPQMASELASGRISIGMPEEAVEALIKSLGHRILKKEALDVGITRITYRMVAMDSVGKTHAAQGIILFRDGCVMSADVIPIN